MTEEAKKRQEEVERCHEEELKRAAEREANGNNLLSCKLFPGTLKEVTMRWFSSLPSRSITSFTNLAAAYKSQFVANKTKHLEVADLSDIKQSKTETLKQYLARFNATIVQVNDPDQKFYVKAFQKGLEVGPFSDSLALSQPTSKTKIRA
ncbi:hypothetical protein CR513_08425, partial [Mucuna pruriens]